MRLTEEVQNKWDASIDAFRVPPKVLDKLVQRNFARFEPPIFPVIVQRQHSVLWISGDHVKGPLGAIILFTERRPHTFQILLGDALKERACETCAVCIFGVY